MCKDSNDSVALQPNLSALVQDGADRYIASLEGPCGSEQYTAGLKDERIAERLNHSNLCTSEFR